MSIANFSLQWLRDDCGYCEYRYEYLPETTTPYPTTPWIADGSSEVKNWIKVDQLTDEQRALNGTKGHTYTWYCYDQWINEYDYYYCIDSCDGGYYLDGLWGTFFAFIASIIAWCGSCKKLPEPFTVLYRVQATFVSCLETR